MPLDMGRFATKVGPPKRSAKTCDRASMLIGTQYLFTKFGVTLLGFDVERRALRHRLRPGEIETYRCKDIFVKRLREMGIEQRSHNFSDKGVTSPQGLGEGFWQMAT